MTLMRLPICQIFKSTIVRHIDVVKIKSLLKRECIACDLFQKLGEKTQCPECPFYTTSGSKRGYKLRIGLKAIFRDCGSGLTTADIRRFGKHHLFQFLYDPSLNWDLPKDVFGNSLNLHHINGNHFDDREINHEWATKSEHKKQDAVHLKVSRAFKKEVDRLGRELRIINKRASDHEIRSFNLEQEKITNNENKKYNEQLINENKSLKEEINKLKGELDALSNIQQLAI